MRLLLAGAAVLACMTLPVRAQDAEPRTISFDGPEVFCHVLNELGLKPIDRLDAKIDPKKSMIIVFGFQAQHKLDEIRQAVRGLDAFLTAGGALLVATDYPLQSRDPVIQVSGDRIERNDHAYAGNKQCPWIPCPDGTGPGAGHPIFQFLKKKIATNCPSTMRDWSVGKTALLNFADPPRVGRFHRSAGTYMVGSIWDAPPEGRSLYIAGHGMFMNGMMLQQDNDNFLFTANAVRWLREGPGSASRTQALFIVDGEIVTNFDADLSPKPPPLPMPTVRKLDRLLRGIEEEGVIPRIIEDNLDLPRSVAVGLALATFGLLVYSAKKFMEGRHLPEMSLPSALASGPVGAMPVITQRMHALIRKNHLGEEARAAVRAWLQEHGSSEPERAELRITAAAPRRRELERQAQTVLRIARSATTIRVTRREFRDLMLCLANLEQAVRDHHAAPASRAHD